MNWSVQAVPDLTGRVIVITGANTGIGFEAARVLANRGAAVVLACRSESRARAAKERILAHKPPGSVDTVPLDLASLASVESAAAALLARDAPIDLLINNAGVMDTPYSRTVDGFERQLGTNHLGHFALTGRLLPKLLEASGSRVVNVSSVAHRRGALDFDDLVYENGYTPDKTSHAVTVSSGLGESGVRSGERRGFVVALCGGQAVVEAAEKAVEQVALGGCMAVAGLAPSVVVGSGPG